MKSLTCFLLLLWGGLSLAASPLKLTLSYEINGESVLVDGFEGLNPYYVVDGEKVFPEMGGTWLVDADFEVLKKFGYLPDTYSLSKHAKSFKERNESGHYHLILAQEELFPTQIGERKDRSYVYWNTEEMGDSGEIIVVCAWVYEGSGKALLATSESKDLQLLNLNNTGWDEVAESEKEGYPIILFLDPKTLEALAPETSPSNRGAYLNWLMKAGSDSEIEAAFQDEYSKKLFSNSESNPLHLMALYRRESLLERIPELEDLSRFQNELEQTVGHLAAAVGNDRILKLLKNPKKFLQKTNSKGFMPVHSAVENGHTELSIWLIETFNMHREKVWNSWMTPLAVALNARRTELVEFLAKTKHRKFSMESTSRDGMLYSLCQFGQLPLIDYLLTYYPERFKPSERFDPIGAAIESGNPEVLERLLDRVEGLGYKHTESKTTYLHLAALRNEVDMIEPLVAKGIDINGVTEKGLSALYGAVTNNALESTLKLLELGADPDITPHNGSSAIWAATYLGNREEIQALIEAGASCELDPEFANTMVEYATLYDVPEVVLIALDECLSEDYVLFDEFPGIYVADFFNSAGVKEVLEERGQSMDSIVKPTLADVSELDNDIVYIEQPAPSYPKELMAKYGTVETQVTAFFSKSGHLILPKFEPALPPDLTRHVRESLADWRIEPPTSGGAPVNLKVSFFLEMKEVIEKEEIYELEALDVLPKPIRRVAPTYPRKLKSMGIQSEVSLIFVVLEDGTVSDIQVEKMGSPEFAEEAVKALKLWTFEPGMIDGKPVKVRLRIPMAFTLRR